MSKYDWDTEGDGERFLGKHPPGVSRICIVPTGELTRKAKRSKYTFIVYDHNGVGHSPIYKSKSGYRSWSDLPGTRRYAILVAVAWGEKWLKQQSE